MNHGSPHATIHKVLPTILLLWGTVFVINNARSIIGPLSTDIGVSLQVPAYHVIVATMFFSVGNMIALLLSGHISYWLMHTRTLILSLITLAIGMLLTSMVQNISTLKIAFFIIGLGGGLYPGSGITIANTMSSEKIRGTVMAIHETGPAGAFVFAPIIASLGLLITSWRIVLAVLSVFCILLAILTLIGCKEGNFRGKPLTFSNLGSVFSKPAFWIIAISFAVAGSSNLIFFSAVRAFLIDNHNFSDEHANLIISLSRVSSIVMIFLSGAAIRKLSELHIMIFTGTVAGILTILLAVTSGSQLFIVVFLQPFVLSGFFPAGLIAMGRFFQGTFQGLSISMMILFLNISNAILPYVYGMFSEIHHVDLMFVTIGSTIIFTSLSIIIVHYLPKPLPPSPPSS